jgi:hypothetical protein
MYVNETVRTIVNGDDDDPWIFATVRPSSSSSASTAVEETKEVGTVKRIPSPSTVLLLHEISDLRNSDELKRIIPMTNIVRSNPALYQKTSQPAQNHSAPVKIVITLQRKLPSALYLVPSKIPEKVFETLRNELQHLRGYLKSQQWGENLLRL